MCSIIELLRRQQVQSLADANLAQNETQKPSKRLTNALALRTFPPRSLAFKIIRVAPPRYKWERRIDTRDALPISRDVPNVFNFQPPTLLSNNPPSTCQLEALDPLLTTPGLG
jgi:hypothetical protein